MANQLEIKRERYIEACRIKAEIEAEFFWDHQLGRAPTITTDPEDLLTREQAAKLLTKSVSWVRKQEGLGVIPKVAGLGDKSVRYYRSDIERIKQTLEP